MSQNINDLFANAHQDGTLSSDAFNTLSVMDMGEQIQSGLGICVDDVTASEVVLLTIMPDDSGSIAQAGNTRSVIQGHNMVIDILKKSNQQDNILAHTRYLNGQVLFPYSLLSHSVNMDTKNYKANKGTPLYDQTIVLLATVLAKAQAFAQNGVYVRTVTLIITDGEDVHSVKADEKAVKKVIDSMLMAEDHLIFAMGIDNGHVPFRKIFNQMGISDEYILTPGSNPVEIRRAFEVFSQSALRHSQINTMVSQNAMGGFGS